MPKRIVAVSLMGLSVLSVPHKPAEAAPLSTRGAVAGTMNMAEPIGGCGACYGPRATRRPGWGEGYRHRPRVQGWSSRRASTYRSRPKAAGSARWDPGFRYGAASWGDQRAWTYYGRW